MVLLRNITKFIVKINIFILNIIVDILLRFSNLTVYFNCYKLLYNLINCLMYKWFSKELIYLRFLSKIKRIIEIIKCLN